MTKTRTAPKRAPRLYLRRYAVRTEGGLLVDLVDALCADDAIDYVLYRWPAFKESVLTVEAA